MDNKSLIVVVTYNSQDFIENCLKSIIEQDYKDWFLVVIDNNSSDSTVRKIKDFRNATIELSSNNFKLISLKKNIGFSRAVNYIVFNYISKKKKGLGKKIKFLILLNPDIYLAGNALYGLISTFKAIKNHDPLKETGVGGGLILDYEKDTIQHLGGRVSPNFITSHIGYGRKYKNLQDEYINKERSQNIEQNNLGGIEQKVEKGIGGKTYKQNMGNTKNIKDRIKSVDYVTGALFATSFPLFKKLGGFDSGYRPMYFEELDYCLRVKSTGRRVVVNLNSIARHFEGASVEKFSSKFYRYYHKNRIRCAIINLGFFDFLKKFFTCELIWLRNKATGDQISSLFYAYFINIVFLPNI